MGPRARVYVFRKGPGSVCFRLQGGHVRLETVEIGFSRISGSRFGLTGVSAPSLTLSLSVPDYLGTVCEARRRSPAKISVAWKDLCDTSWNHKEMPRNNGNG